MKSQLIAISHSRNIKKNTRISRFSSGPENARWLLGYTKISSKYSFPYKRYKTITVCRCKQLTSKSLQTCLCSIYLFKVHDISVITLLTNDLTNVCSKISKIPLILWMAILTIRKSLRKLKRWEETECTLNFWPRSSQMSDCSIPFQ